MAIQYLSGINVSGSVGIGTDSPEVNRVLDVNGSMAVRSTIYVAPAIGETSNSAYSIEIGQGRTGNGYAFLDFVTDDTYTDHGLRIIRGNTGANTFSEIKHRGTGLFKFAAQEAANMTFLTSNSERMRITSTGNVGIGTTSPGAKLHVDGTAIFDTQTGAQPFYITRDGAADQALKIYVDDSAAIFESVQDETDDNYGAFQFILDAGVTEPYFDVRKGTALANTLFRVDGNGNVGIGTTSPSTKLQLTGTGSDTTLGLSITNTDNADISFRKKSGFNNTLEIVNANNDIDIIAGTSSRVFIESSNGNVGIGITSPSEKLHVSGNVRVTGSFKDSSGDSGTSGQVLSSTGSGTNWINNTAAGITGVTAGTGLTGGGTSGTVTLNVIGGAGITANANDIAVDSTVLRTSGNQTSSGVKSFSTYIKTSRIDTNNGQQLVLNAGEAGGQATGQTNELVYLNAESGIQINSSPDNWSSGWAGRKTTYINNSTGDSSFSRNVTVGGDLTVSGGDITLSGTGRIQGVDTVSAGTDAVNKTYVDNAIAGVPQGDITSVTAGNGLTGGGTSGGVSLNVDTTVVRTTGAQTIAGAKIFSDDIRFNDDILDSGGDTGSAGQVLVATGQGSVNWVNQTNTNNFVNAATFNTSNGIITGTGSGSAGFTVDIDGRYPTGNAANQPFFLHLQQNTVGTTYGNGVAAVPSYYFGQLAGDNDGMRFYAESAASNDVTAVWEINDDLETGLSWLFRNKKTYSPYTAIDAMKIDGDGDVTIGKDLTITGGDIILSGTGRIQGVDTVTSATDAASKAYVDNAVAGVPQGDITSVAAGNGLTGGGTSGAVTLNVVGGYGITANADNITIDASVVTLTGSQALTNKTGSNSQWTNDEGYTTNTGDITAVTAGTNLNGGGTSGAVTLNLNSNINLDEVNIGQGIELKESADRADLLQITSATSSWAGIQVRNSADDGRWSFMTDGNTAGFYDDQQNEWAVQMIENGAVKLYNNSFEKLTTTSAGVQVNGTLVLNGTGRIQGVDTVSSGTDAANKTYVDNAIAGVPQGDITAVTVSNGLLGGGTSGSVNIAPNYSASSSNLIHSAPVTTSTGAKTYTPYILVAESNPGVGSGAVNKIKLENINLDRFGNTLGVGKTIRLSRNTLSTSNSTSPIYVDNTSTGNGTSYNYDSDVSSYFGSRHMAFRYNGTVRGSISQSGTTNVAFNTSNSDERLKKNIEIWDENILEKFEEIEPKKFNYLEDEDGQEKTKGYIAQKMVDSFPEAYPTDFSEENYYNYNPSGMVVYLTKAIKELIEKNKQLENRIQTLENS